MAEIEHFLTVCQGDVVRVEEDDQEKEKRRGKERERGNSRLPTACSRFVPLGRPARMIVRVDNRQQKRRETQGARPNFAS